ncbi:hypothetical protein [Providencia sp. PROV274]|uniref:hypothetical protein n=1 Tax=Providencia sp. PROV274 TaxID=2949961 RepID=UPI00234BBB1C|nr:hypothetical protein [Providencia sp. PROV274]
MSLMDTFVQVFEFDTRQADSAFEKVQRSTDDIIADMKQVSESAKGEVTSLTGFLSQVASSLQAGAESVNVDINLDAPKEDMAAYLDEMKRYLEYAKSLHQSNVLSTDSNKKLASGIQALESNIQRAEGSLSDQIVVTGKAANEVEKLANKNAKLAKSADDVSSHYGKATHSLSGFLVKMAGMVGIGLTIGGIASFVQSTAEEVNLLSQSADALSLPVEEVDAFGKVITSMGGDAQGARDSLMDMSESIGEALQDTSSGKAEVFKSLKISLKDMQGDSINAMEGLYRLSDAVQGLSKEEAIFRIKEVGITDNKIVESILKGRKELEALTKKQKENGVVTKELALQAQKYKEVTGGLKTVFSSVMMSIMNAALPALTKILSWVQTFVKFCSENKGLITGFFIAIGTVLAAYYIPSMIAAAAATLAATWPILAIIAVIALLAAAFAFVYDDIMNFIDGNDSMIGRILDEYPELKAVILALWDAFKSFFDFVIALSKVVADVAVAAFNFIVDGGKQFWKWLNEFIDGLMGWGKQFEGVFNIVSDAVVGIFKWLWAQIKQYLGWINDGLDAIKNGWSTVKGWFGFEDAEVTQTVERKISADGTIEHQIPESPKLSEDDTALLVQGLSQQINSMSANPMNPMTSQAISNQSSTTNENTVNVGELNINTQATDAQGIAKDAKGELQSQLQDLGHQTSSGVGK